MKPITVNLLKDFLLFSLMLFGVYLLNVAIMNMLNTHTSWENNWERGIRLFLYHVGCATLLFWFLNRRIKDGVSNYWKLVLLAVLLFLIRYHLTFSFELLDYYLIHPIPKTNNIYLQIAESLKPIYNPIREFSLAITSLYYLPQYQDWFVDTILGFVFGSFMMSLWMPGLIIFNFKRKNNFKNKEL